MGIAIGHGQAVRVLHRFAYALVTDGEPDLSVRQLAILLAIYLDPPPHTVRGLAAKLGVTKPVVTRALDTLGKRELVTRRRDDTDRRNVVIQRTQQGTKAVQRLGEMLADAAQDSTA
jgi:DNA-binding MarR family transcriptional regulator